MFVTERDACVPQPEDCPPVVHYKQYTTGCEIEIIKTAGVVIKVSSTVRNKGTDRRKRDRKTGRIKQ